MAMETKAIRASRLEGLGLRPPKLFVNSPHAFDKAVKGESALTRRITFVPLADVRRSGIEIGKVTYQISANLVESNPDFFHTSLTIMPSSLSSFSTVSSTIPLSR